MAEETKEEKKEEKPTPKDNLVVTKHSMKIGGKEIKYTVTAGTMILKDETTDREKESEGEKPRAQVFFVAYTKDGVRDPSKRPLTFSFNGGPGSSSVWMHLGMLGPRRVLLQGDGELPPPSSALLPMPTAVSGVTETLPTSLSMGWIIACTSAALA